VNELELAEMVDELAREFLEGEHSDRMEVFDAELTEREAEMATVELHRRGLPIRVRSTDALSSADRADWFGGP
jgi:hypothetical protein